MTVVVRTAENFTEIHDADGFFVAEDRLVVTRKSKVLGYEGCTQTLAIYAQDAWLSVGYGE